MPSRTRRRKVTTSKQRPEPKPAARKPRRAARRRPGALTALFALIAVGAGVAIALSLRETQTALVSERTVTVSKGVIETVVSGSGNLEPARQLDLNFATSGKVTKIYVKAGQHVSKGELIARLDDRSQRVAVAKAQADLVDAQDALDAANSSTVSTTTSSNTVLASADDAVATAAVASDADEAEASAKFVALLAQATPQATETPTTPEATETPAPSATGTPTPDATQAPDPSPAPSATAEPRESPTATATAAPGGTSRSGGGATPSGSGGGTASGGGAASGGGSTQSVESAQAAVDSAELALDEAKDALEDTELRAPFAATVASVNGSVGDTAGTSSGSSSSSGTSAGGGLGGGATSSSSSSSSGFVVLAQLSRLKLDVGLSESDIGKVEVGQSATLTINAASGEQVAGHVTDVGVLASESSSSSGAVSYPVTVTLDQSTEGIRSGMSATADIVVERVSGLSVPSQALQGSTVTVERDGGKRETVRVQTGVVGDSATQVVSGLSAGDKVIVTSTSAIAGQAASGGGAAGGRGGIGGASGFGGGLGGGGFRAAGGFGGGPPGGGPGGGP